jgi:glycogen operon protein
MKRNLLATLAFSQGVPMLSHGDELGRTQSGNNNAYCQDSPLTWIDWQLTPPQRELLQFTSDVLAIRAATPLLRSDRFFPHLPGEESGPELAWLNAEGKEMTAEEWNHPSNHVLGMLLRGGDAGEALLLLLNGGARSKPFTLPRLSHGGDWMELINTTHPGPPILGQGQLILRARSLLLLRFTPAPAHR